MFNGTVEQGTLKRIQTIESDKFDQNKHEVTNEEQRNDHWLHIISGKLFLSYWNPRYVTNFEGLTDLLQAQQSALKLQAVVESADLREKISFFEKNIESSLHQDHMINQEIKKVKMNVESVKTELTNHIKNISEAQNQMNLKINEISASMEELQSVQKAQKEMRLKIKDIASSFEELKYNSKTVIAFRATCAKNFPRNSSTRMDENPGRNAFFLKIIHQFRTPTITLVIWKNIEYNVGNAFDESKGIFTCPYDGIYYFYSTALVSHSKDAHSYIYVNGANRADHHVNPGYAHSNPNGLLKLKKGDKVHIRMIGYFYFASSECARTYIQGYLVDLL